MEREAYVPCVQSPALCRALLTQDATPKPYPRRAAVTVSDRSITAAAIPKALSRARSGSGCACTTVPREDCNSARSIRTWSETHGRALSLAVAFAEPSPPELSPFLMGARVFSQTEKGSIAPCDNSSHRSDYPSASNGQLGTNLAENSSERLDQQRSSQSKIFLASHRTPHIQRSFWDRNSGRVRSEMCRRPTSIKLILLSH